MTEKETRISVRIDADLKARLAQTCSESGMNESDLIRKCVESLCDHWEQNNYFLTPFEIRPKGFKVIAPDIPREPLANIKDYKSKLNELAADEEFRVAEEQNQIGGGLIDLPNNKAPGSGTPKSPKSKHQRSKSDT